MQSTKGLEPSRHDSPIYRVSPDLTSRELLEMAIKKLEQELTEVLGQNPAPEGEWIVWIAGKKPQIRYMKGGRAKSRSIEPSEASEWVRRKLLRDVAHSICAKIETLKAILGDW